MGYITVWSSFLRCVMLSLLREITGERNGGMEIWGHCAHCDVWFPCLDWFDRSAPPPCCPFCGADPWAIENRAPRVLVLEA